MSHNSFYLKNDAFQSSLASCQNNWATFVKKLHPRTFKNRPIWSHWIDRQHISFHVDLQRQNKKYDLWHAEWQIIPRCLEMLLDPIVDRER